MASPNNQNSADSSVKQSLEAGLTALKERDYPRAIALLESVAETAVDKSLATRAKMRLVAAYTTTGNLKGAIALCTSLTENPNPQVKTWADRTLAQLIDRHPPKPPETPPETGFVAFEIGTELPKISPTADKPSADTKTEFVPFEQTGGQKSLKSPHIPPLPAPPKPSLVKNSEAEATTTAPDRNSPTDIPEAITPDTYELSWRNSGRAPAGWRKLKAMKLEGLWVEAIASTIALFFLTRFILEFLLTNINSLLVQLYIFTRLPFFTPIQLFYRDPTQFIQFIFGLLLASSPWLTDALLKLICGIEPLGGITLLKSSKEANRVIRSFCKQQNMPAPMLKLLPIDVPVAFSYGCLPRFARIVVSQGLLDRLTEDEIATILARELGHIAHWDFAPMSLAVLVMQIPYMIYWQVTHWEERLSALITIAFFRSVVKVLAALISAGSYGIYKLLRWPMLWVSRHRVYLSDRTAAEITGNPNGLTRALAKIAIGMAQNIEQQQQTSFFLEGFDLLFPVGIREAVTIGSAGLHAPLEEILLWDVSNPYRNWLTVNSGHPLVGERLKLLALYAKFWELETELDLANLGTLQPTKGKFVLFKLFDSIFRAGTNNSRAGTGAPPLLLQGAPFFGIPMSLGIVGVLWLIGWMLSRTSFWQLDWLWGDRSILWGCLPIGFCLGTLFRINDFFPDILPRNIAEPSLPQILSNSETLPLDAQAVRLEGMLLGRSGMANLLGQDLILQTATGLVRLHYVSRFGPIGSLWSFLSKFIGRTQQCCVPTDLLGKLVVATGWLRRGANVAIDLETIRSEGGRVSHSGHPIWSAILAFAAAFWGAYIIFQGEMNRF
ncbi:M48 family metalloprotease [Tychonema sp. BBK16]|uniref:M48 family metalloprotease n=1 Tax=Tychonema sp. BBK16 TaxID=2699888 RepID=UPI001F21C5E4|nr:zinc metalloprotease HtpX [Tychonema sp. BBK16]MCF6373210.1 zinc metalloprotease HtpX [Tychonema sp. BBK16]